MFSLLISINKTHVVGELGKEMPNKSTNKLQFTAVNTKTFCYYS